MIETYNMLEFAIDMLEQARLSRNQNIPPPSSVTTTFLLKKLCSRLRIEESNKIDVKKQLFYYFFNGTFMVMLIHATSYSIYVWEF